MARTFLCRLAIFIVKEWELNDGSRSERCRSSFQFSFFSVLMIDNRHHIIAHLTNSYASGVNRCIKANKGEKVDG